MINSPWGPVEAAFVMPWAIVLGLVVGSFANVLIYRLPLEKSLISPPSHCPSCGRPIKPWENIPLLSYIFLAGRCKGCKVHISIRYPLVELASGIFAGISVQIYGVSYASLAYGLLFIALLALILIDLEHWLLPFAITVPMTLIGLAGSIFFDLRPLADSLLGMLTGFAIFMLMLLGGKLIFKRDALGGGDVVFGVMAGVFLGWKLTILMIFVASFLGTLAALPLLIMGKNISEKAIPFGPFLAVSLVVCLFAGNPVISWYIRLVSG